LPLRELLLLEFEELFGELFELELLELLLLEFEDELELELSELFDDEFELELSELLELELLELLSLEFDDEFELELSELLELELLELLPLELDEELELLLLELFDWKAIVLPAAFMTGASADPRFARTAACAPPVASAPAATMILSLCFILLSFQRATASPPGGARRLRRRAAECCNRMTGLGEISGGLKRREIFPSPVTTTLVPALEYALNPT
jgi:hypothetical protein